MIFGALPLKDALGAVLAHSVQAGPHRLRKGAVLDAEMLARLAAAGIEDVTVARTEPGDLGEDDAAEALASCLGKSTGLARAKPFTGRVNVLAEMAGVLRVDAAAIAAFNAVDPGITIATLPPFARVEAGMMAATIKVIPYAVPGPAVAEAAAHLAGALSVAPRVITRAALVMTRTDALPEKALAKGEAVVRARLAALEVDLEAVKIVPHDVAPIAEALSAQDAPLRLILGASATSDKRDTCPLAVEAAGGAMGRFGMPVDPGNLLFTGRIGGAQVVGLPGCARSPALNGADWVLERLVSGLEVGDGEIAAMGVGGLLKEIPTRPQPRAMPKRPARAAPRVAILLLAAGQSRRMRGRDKLLEPVGDLPLLRRAAQEALAAGAAEVRVVLPPGGAARMEVLKGLSVETVIAEAAEAGMAASLAAGVRALGEDIDGVIVALADMPDVGSAAYKALIAAFAPGEGAEICRAVSEDGRAGHPVLFARRFFEALAAQTGDQGGRQILREAEGFIKDVPLPGRAAVTDLDTPEDWAAYRARGG